MKKLFLFCTIIASLFSCSSEENSLTDKSLVSFEQENIKKLKENPNILFSKKYSSIEVLNQTTNEMGMFYFETQSGTNNKVHVTRGLYYSGGDCAIWGTIYYDDVTNATVFIAASAATQSLMNVCGLSNVARIKN